MKRSLTFLVCLILAACTQDPYRLKIENNMTGDHGQSIYFRSNLRSNYAGQIRRVLSNKFGEIGMKTSASAESADFIAIFDIETFYKQTEAYKNTSYANTRSDSALFTAEEDGTSLAYTGNANMVVDRDKTCFTLNIGRRETSSPRYTSSFCAQTVMEPEDMLPLILDIYGKYGNYQSADVGVQCLTDQNGKISCDTVHDRQQAFVNSLWIDSDINDEVY